ncbi:MAG TPA: NAD(P)H-dependent oxidoreductase subunit E [Bryobacteraceae bacterium]|nr:NAD(P)H-dependent oxidoreductase subunit E [Bryobacteraceae bacterium]
MSRRRWAWISGCVAALCVAILIADYLAALRRPLDSKIPAERLRITAARLSRKQRDDRAAWVLMAAAAAFLACARQGARPKVPKPARLAATMVRRPPPPAVAPVAPEIEFSAFVEDAIARLGRGKESAIPLLQAIQAHYRYLPDEALRHLCALTEITPAEIAGTSSFYARFRRSPVGKHVVRVCHGTACHVAGARQITDELRRYLAIPEGADTDPARQFTIDEVACLGCCSLAPVLMVDGRPAGKLTPVTACEALRDDV